MAREPEKMSTFDERITWNEGDIQFVDADGNPIDPKKMKAQITEPPEDDETAGGPTLHEQATPERRKMNGRAIERRNLLILTTIAYEAGYGAYLPVV
ncbi:MAG TPA: hypothetical protein VLA02_12700, partial [Reyranella sp.]|nr:hypothetical protein [Reyranella sp.]